MLIKRYWKLWTGLGNPINGRHIIIRDPLGLTFYTTAQTNAYYDLLNAYLEAYEEVNGEPLYMTEDWRKDNRLRQESFNLTDQRLFI